MSMSRSSHKRPSKRPTKSAVSTANVPQPENLLDELQYGDALAEYFDLLYPESTMGRIQKPFYKMIIGKYRPLSAFDVSCRTGQTLRLLQELGIRRLGGADVSGKMLQRARKRLPRSCRLNAADIQSPFSALKDQVFDLIICTKDALSLALDDEALQKFFLCARKHLTENGLLIVETLNYEKIWKNRERFMPLLDRSLKSHPRLFTMIHDFHQELLVRNLMLLEIQKKEWYWRALSTPIRPVTRSEIDFFVKEAGFSRWGFLGGYAGKPFNPLESFYTILLAKR